MNTIDNILFDLFGFEIFAKDIKCSAKSCAYASYLCYGDDAIDHTIQGADDLATRLRSSGMPEKRVRAIQRLFNETAEEIIQRLGKGHP
jgi:hypothetical protein